MLIWGCGAAAKSRPGSGYTKPSAPLKVLTFATHSPAPHCHAPLFCPLSRRDVWEVFIQFGVAPFSPPFQPYGTSTEVATVSVHLHLPLFHFLLPVSCTLTFCPVFCVSLPCCCFVSLLCDVVDHLLQFPLVSLCSQVIYLTAVIVWFNSFIVYFFCSLQWGVKKLAKKQRKDQRCALCLPQML